MHCTIYYIYRSKLFIGLKECPQHRGSGGIGLAQRHLILEKIVAESLTQKYDWFVITRTGIKIRYK